MKLKSEKGRTCERFQENVKGSISNVKGRKYKEMENEKVQKYGKVENERKVENMKGQKMEKIKMTKHRPQKGR